MQEETDDVFRPSKLRALLEHFGTIDDPREPPKVRYPLREVLFLVVAATIADCEDYDEIALWGKSHLSFVVSPNSTSERPVPTGCAWS
jgi:hypothetical protein